MQIGLYIALALFPFVGHAAADVCGPHKVKKVSVEKISTLSSPLEKVANSILPNMVRFSERDGSGFVLSKVDKESSLMLTASHVARTLIHGTDRRKMRIGFPILNSNLPPTSDAQVGFFRAGTLNKYFAQRLYTPTVEFNPSRELVYEQVLKPNVDFTLLKVKNETLRDGVKSLTWTKPREGQKVMILGKDTVSVGCLDQLYPDSTFDTDANVEDGMSGGMVVDAETGKVIGVLTIAFTKDGKDDGSGGVSIQTIVDHINGKRKDPFLAEHFEKTKLLPSLMDASDGTSDTSKGSSTKEPEAKAVD